MDSTIYKKIEGYLMGIIMQNASIPDYQLPSERMLSMTFNASCKPVRRAYLNLIARGYVTNIHGRGYFISPGAMQEASSSTEWNNPSIALIIPSIQTQFCHDILTGVSSFCSSHQLELAIRISDASAEKEAYMLRSAPASGTKGIILFPVDHENPYHNELMQLSIRKSPLVLVDRMVSNIHASFISSENHQAMVNAVEFFAEEKI